LTSNDLWFAFNRLSSSFCGVTDWNFSRRWSFFSSFMVHHCSLYALTSVQTVKLYRTVRGSTHRVMEL
jgi:hypothetical protein